MNISKLAEFFQDGSGALSSVRLVFITYSLVILGVWGYASFKAGSISTIPESVVSLFGVVVAGKTFQGFGEKSNTPPPTA